MKALLKRYGLITNLTAGYHACLTERTTIMLTYEEFFEKFVKIGNPAKGSIPLVLKPQQRQLLNLFEHNKYVISKKYRQGGFTTAIVAYAIYECLTKPNIKYFFGSMTHGTNAHIKQLVEFIIDQLPHPMESDCYFNQKSNLNSLRVPILNSSIHFKSLNDTQNPTSDSGYNRIVLDEAAYIKNMYTQWKIISNKASDDAKFLILSSPSKNPLCWFQSTFQDAEKGLNPFIIHSPQYSHETEKDEHCYLNETEYGIFPELQEKMSMPELVAKVREIADNEIKSFEDKLYVHKFIDEMLWYKTIDEVHINSI